MAVELVNVRGLHKYFNSTHVLKGIDLKAQDGELISIIGRSGCGKTTLLRCLNCLEILDAGYMEIAGIVLEVKNRNEGFKSELQKKATAIRHKVGLPFQGFETTPSLDDDFQIRAHKLRSKVGMLFQSLNLFTNMTVIENITKPLVIVKQESKNNAVKIAKNVLQKVGLLEYTERFPHELSGGQAQRVAIARALAMQPKIMLYDEPTSALDPELVDEVISVMKKLNEEGMTQIVVTHSMKFAKSASDKVIYMEDGEIIEVGPPDKIFNYPADERTKKYLKILDA